jgi:hypothetical protein
MARSDQGIPLQEWRRGAEDLARSFAAGAQPKPVAVRFAMNRGEFCVGEAPIVVYQWLEGDNSYTHKGGGYVIGTSPAGFVLGSAFSAARLATNVAGNQRRRARAGREGAARWRPIDAGHLYVTNLRFTVVGQHNRWTDIWFSDVRLSDCEPNAIILELSGQQPLRLEIPAAEYWYVMFRKLAYGEVAALPQQGAGPESELESAHSRPLPGSVSPSGEQFAKILIGLWVSSSDSRQRLSIDRDGRFVLQITDGTSMSGSASVAGNNLTLTAGNGQQTSFTWACEADALRLIRDDGSVSNYRRD